VSAGSFRLDRGTKSISQLFTAIGDYDPLVRHYPKKENGNLAITRQIALYQANGSIRVPDFGSPCG
jgi:hypothetical protein